MEKVHTVGSAKIHPKPKIEKTPPAEIEPFFNTYRWVELMVKFWGGVSQAPFEILALKGPNLAQMAKYLLRGLESQTRPLFNTVLITEYGFNIKITNIVFRRSYLAHFGQNWVKIRSKSSQNGQKRIKRPREPNKTTFPYSFWSLSMNLT